MKNQIIDTSKVDAFETSEAHHDDYGEAQIDDGVMSKIVNRLSIIAENTHRVSMGPLMAKYLQSSVKGIPRVKAQQVYIDDSDDVRALFAEAKDVAQLDQYLAALKDFQRHTRDGREPFDRFMNGVVAQIEDRAREQKRMEQTYGRHASGNGKKVS